MRRMSIYFHSQTFGQVSLIVGLVLGRNPIH